MGIYIGTHVRRVVEGVPVAGKAESLDDAKGQFRDSFERMIAASWPACDFTHFTIQRHRLNVSEAFEQEVPMRSVHAIAIAVIILVGFGLKLFFFTPSALAEVHGLGVDVSRMHENKNLPAQQFHDMTFVFSTAD